MVMAFVGSIVRPFAYLSVPFFLLRSFASKSTVARYHIRQGLYVTTMMTVAACSAVIAAGMCIIGSRFDVDFVVARTFYAVASRALELTVDVEGEEHINKGPAVLMANHQTMLDILIVGRIMPKKASIMAKKSLQFTPLGPFMTMSGAIFIDRGNNQRAIRSLNAAGALMQRLGLSLWIFPEGTRTSREVPDIRPLKKGGFHLAIQAGIPIVPIVTENYWRLYHKGTFETGNIKVRVLPPISTKGLTVADIPELTMRVHNQMLTALREISVNPTPVVDNGSERPKTEEKEPTPLKPLLTDATPQASASGSGNVPETLALGPNSSPSIPERGDVAASSSSSLASSFSGSTLSGLSDVGDAGVDTEEDEGMIVVGRPS